MGTDPFQLRFLALHGGGRMKNKMATINEQLKKLIVSIFMFGLFIRVGWSAASTNRQTRRLPSSSAEVPEAVGIVTNTSPCATTCSPSASSTTTTATTIPWPHISATISSTTTTKLSHSSSNNTWRWMSRRMHPSPITTATTSISNTTSNNNNNIPTTLWFTCCRSAVVVAPTKATTTTTTPPPTAWITIQPPPTRPSQSVSRPFSFISWYSSFIHTQLKWNCVVGHWSTHIFIHLPFSNWWVMGRFRWVGSRRIGINQSLFRFSKIFLVNKIFRKKLGGDNNYSIFFLILWAFCPSGVSAKNAFKCAAPSAGLVALKLNKKKGVVLPVVNCDTASWIG